MAGESLARTHPFSLGAPIANEEERAQFQKRLALTWMLVGALAATFWLVASGFLALKGPDHLQHMWTRPSSRVQLATTGTAFVAWLFTRSAKRSPKVLDAIDAVSSIALCLGWAAMLALEPGRPRGELVSLMAITYTLVMRSALIPSTPARTALLAALAHVPLIVITHLHHASGKIQQDAPLAPAVYVVIWAVVGVGAMTATTWVIYGLRVQVRRAMQLGQYFLEDRIGAGGMGAVYRARHAMLRRPTAIKLLSEGSGAAIERFEREVQITARLTHPNTIAIFDYGRTPDGVFYYAMEYLDGISIEELVDASGPQPPARVVHVLLQVCGALREAHLEGLVHRDIKPANIMLTSRGGIPDFVKVLDFGLVKETVSRELSRDAAVTNASAILGTPHYMAPESILDPSTVDGRTDIYALGATAYVMLTGKRVFEGANLVEVCSKHIHEAPRAPSASIRDIPPALDRVVLACLAKRPEERPADASTLAAMLRETGVPAWTDADASQWWSKHQTTRSRRDVASAPSVFGDTIAVAIESRVRAENAS